MTGRVRAFLTVLALSAAFLYLAALYGLLARVLLFLKFNDFGKFYLSVQQFRHGVSLYAPNEATLIPLSKDVSREFLNLNPPHFHLIVLPFAFLPEGIAYLAWLACNAFLLFVSWRAICRERRMTLTWDQSLIAALLFAAAAPTMAWMVTGQVTGILVAITTRIWLDARTGRWRRAGIGIGLACALKVFFAPLALYLLLRRQWGALLAASAAIAVTVAAGVGLFGLAEYRAWIAALSAVNWQWPPMNASATAPLARVTSGDPLQAGHAAPGIAPLLTVSAAIVALAGTWIAVTARRIDDAFTVLLLTCILASPLGWVYYHWIVAGPAMVTFQRRTAVVIVACAAFLIPFIVLFPWPSVLFAGTLGSLYSWATLALWGSAIVRSRAAG
ncbi:MAG TPA: glycosyltransferase family 87 protein [Vicinamibacterales bacterium]|nr:glycosyltransferase family 87 protein [Vicinamibacterales bacterium]